MTNRRTAQRSAAAIVLAVLLSCVPATAQKSLQISDTASPAVISGPLADYFPDDTNVYVEIAGARTESERAAVAELYGQLTTMVAGMANEFPLSLEEFQVLAASNIAVSFRIPGTGTSSAEWLGIVRATDAAAATMLASKFVKFAGPAQSGPKAPRSTVVRGRKVMSLTASKSSDSASYCIADNTILIGDSASIGRALVSTATTKSKALSSTALYRDGRARVGESVGLLTVVQTASGQSESAARPEGDPSISSMIGTESLRGVVSGAEPWSPGSEGVTLFAIERDKQNLLSILSSGPPIMLRTADLLPADTGLVASISLDIVAIESLLRTSSAAMFAGLGFGELERQFLAGLREQLLPVIGNEITFGLSIEMPPPSMTMGEQDAVQMSPAMPEFKVVVLLEAKNPERARTAIEGLLMSTNKGASSSREVHGVRLFEAGTTAVAIVDGVAILGPPADVERVLLSRSVEQTLGTSHELVGAQNLLDVSTIALVHPTARLRDAAASYGSSMGGILGTPMFGLTSFEDTVVRKEALGISITTRGGSAFSAAALGIGVAVAIPSLVSARGAANESAAIGMLRSLGSAQATYFAGHNRYGTMAELAEGKYIDASLHHGVERNGYIFREVQPTATRFEFSAAPAEGSPKNRSFNITEDYVIRESDGRVPPRRKAGKPLG